MGAGAAAGFLWGGPLGAAAGALAANLGGLKGFLRAREHPEDIKNRGLGLMQRHTGPYLERDLVDLPEPIISEKHPPITFEK